MSDRASIYYVSFSFSKRNRWRILDSQWIEDNAREIVKRKQRKEIEMITTGRFHG